MLIAALAASALAIVLVFLTSSRQRWLRTALPAFPMRVSAALAAMVALKGWTELLGTGASTFVWLVMLLLVAIAWSYLSTQRRARR
jgi:hypothetical protein